MLEDAHLALDSPQIAVTALRERALSTLEGAVRALALRPQAQRAVLRRAAGSS